MTQVVPKVVRPKVYIKDLADFQTTRMFVRNGWDVASSIADSDLLVFCGGPDINPQLYGERAIPKTGQINQKLDDAEMTCLNHWYRDKYVVGICRGAQLLNVFAGGKLWQDVDGHRGTHDIFDVETGQFHSVTSTHHQVMRPTKNAEVLAIAMESSYVEGAKGQFKQLMPEPEVIIYRNVKGVDGSRFLCFQPHPERDLETEKYFFQCLKKIWS